MTVPKSEAKIEDPLAIQPYSISLIKAVYGKFFGADDFMKQQGVQMERWMFKKFQQFLGVMNDPSGYSLDFFVEFTPKSSNAGSRRFGSSIAYVKEGLRQRGNIKMEGKSQSDEKFVICADFDSAMPRTFTFKEMDSIKEPERVSTFTIGFGKSCTEDRKITVSVS